MTRTRPQRLRTRSCKRRRKRRGRNNTPSCEEAKALLSEKFGISADEAKRAGGGAFHLQRFISGNEFGLNETPAAERRLAARTLGRIHTALLDYPPLPEGIGANFFKYMTPETAGKSYELSLKTAEKLSMTDEAGELRWRIELMTRLKPARFDLSRLTTVNTHGDYTPNQLIYSDDGQLSVIDWTTACRHPAVWELARSYALSAPECAKGELSAESFIEYITAYLEEARLSAYSLENILSVYFYQITVCDYYGQNFSSSAANKEIFLNQARFSTGMLKCLEKNMQRITEDVQIKLGGKAR